MALVPGLIHAQQAPLSSLDMEDLLYRNESAIIPESIPADNSESPLLLDLNSASAEDLGSSCLFTSYQIQMLLDYREKFGPFYSIYELSAISGFRPSSVLEIKPFVSIKTSRVPGKRHHGKNMLMINLEKSMPVGDAYHVDSTSGDKPSYAGPPLKTSIRIRAHPWKKLSLALSYEKDAGELFLYGNRPQFLSGYLSYEGQSFVKQFVVGNFKLNQGVGLVNGTGFLHRPGNFRINQQSLSRIKPYASLTETMYEQGLACKMGISKFQLLLWTSYHRFSISTRAFKEDPEANNWLNYQHTTGLFRSKSEMETRELAYRIHSGIQILYRHQELTVGLMHGYEWVGPSNKAMKLLREKPDPSPQQKLSIHGNWYKKKLQIFGELSSSEFSSLALFLGTLYNFNDYIQGSLLIHHYGSEYRAWLASSYSSGSHIRNEQGFAFHLHMEPGKNIIAKLTGQVFHYPLPRYLTNVPSGGYRLDLSLQNPANKMIQWRARVVSKTWQASPADLFTKIRPLKDNRISRFDAQLTFKHHDQFRWQSRLVISYFSQQLNPAPGYATLQQVTLSTSPYLKATVQFVLFHVSDWENRIYLYEPGFYYSFSFPAYYGSGQKTTLLLTLKPTNGIRFSAKISGLLNHGNRKWESGIQMRFNF